MKRVAVPDRREGQRRKGDQRTINSPDDWLGGRRKADGRRCAGKDRRKA